MTTPQWILLGIFILSYGVIISETVNRTIASIFEAVLDFIFILTGTCPVLPLRDRRGKGAQNKMILHCREALASGRGASLWLLT